MSVRRAAACFALVASIVAATAQPATAAGPECGDTIVRNATLDHNLVCSGDGIVIGASRLKLNLNGHSIRGNHGGDGVDNTGGHSFVTVQNGTVQGFANGVHVRGGRNTLVTRLTVTGNDSTGVHLEGDTRLNQVTDNFIDGNPDTGVFVQGNRNAVLRNRIFDGTFGIQFQRASDNKAVANQINLAGDAALEVDGQSARNDLANNVIFSSGRGVGLFDQADGNTVRGNQLIGNVREGIWVASGSDRNLIRDNRLFVSGADGIQVAGGNTGNYLLRNYVEGSRDDGIDVGEPVSRIARNLVRGAGLLGIRAVPGVTDGGGNRASETGDPARCTGVVCS